MLPPGMVDTSSIQTGDNANAKTEIDANILCMFRYITRLWRYSMPPDLSLKSKWAARRGNATEQPSVALGGIDVQTK